MAKTVPLSYDGFLRLLSALGCPFFHSATHFLTHIHWDKLSGRASQSCGSLWAGYSTQHSNGKFGYHRIHLWEIWHFSVNPLGVTNGSENRIKLHTPHKKYTVCSETDICNQKVHNLPKAYPRTHRAVPSKMVDSHKLCMNPLKCGQSQLRYAVGFKDSVWERDVNYLINNFYMITSWNDNIWLSWLKVHY